MMVICCPTVPIAESEKTAIPTGVFFINYVFCVYFISIVVCLPCMMVCSQYMPFLLG